MSFINEKKNVSAMSGLPFITWCLHYPQCNVARVTSLAEILEQQKALYYFLSTPQNL